MFCFNSLNTFTGWPYFTKEDIFAFRILSNRLLLEINIDSTCQCVGDNQQWGCQIVCLDCFLFSIFFYKIYLLYGDEFDLQSFYFRKELRKQQVLLFRWLQRPLPEVAQNYQCMSCNHNQQYHNLITKLIPRR